MASCHISARTRVIEFPGHGLFVALCQNITSTVLVRISNYTDTAVTNGVTYFFVVTAVDAGGNPSGPSNEASATPTQEAMLEAHRNGLDKMDVKDGQIGSQSFSHGTAGGPSYQITKVVLRLSREEEAPDGDLASVPDGMSRPVSSA